MVRDKIQKYDPNCPACREFDRRIHIGLIFDISMNLNVDIEHDHD